MCPNFLCVWGILAIVKSVSNVATPPGNYHNFGNHQTSVPIPVVRNFVFKYIHMPTSFDLRGILAIIASVTGLPLGIVAILALIDRNCPNSLGEGAAKFPIS